jgi:hypothetical protein
MVVSCSVFGCQERQKKGSDISFHKCVTYNSLKENCLNIIQYGQH